MPVKFKKGSKEAKAHMAKIRAMRGAGAGKHTDTKSHNVNIKVVSGAIGSLPFTGKFLGVDIKARHYYDDIMIDVGSYAFRYIKGDNITVLSEDIAKAIEKKQKQWEVLTDGDKKKILAKVKQFVSTLKNEFPKGALRKNYNKAKSVKNKTIKPVVKKSAEYYKDSDINKSVRQTGTSNKTKDEMKKAKAPGKRKSATGKTYYERRANRSDKPGSLTGMHKNAPPVYTQTIKLNQAQINDALHQYERWHVLLNNYKNDFKIEKDPTWKKFYANEIKQITAVCKSLKSHINSLKKVK